MRIHYLTHTLRHRHCVSHHTSDLMGGLVSNAVMETHSVCAHKRHVLITTVAIEYEHQKKLKCEYHTTKRKLLIIVSLLIESTQ